MIEYEQATFGTKATVRGPLTPSLVLELRRYEVVELDLNYAKGWVSSDLSFVSELPWLRSLSITDRHIASIEPIHRLHELRTLSVITDCRSEIRFSAFPRLESLALDPWRSGARSLFDCFSLRDLFICSYTGKESAPFGRLVNLESIQLLTASLRELAAFAALKNVWKAKLTYFSGLDSLDGLQGMVGLEQLELTCMRGIASIELLGQLKNLRSLQLSNLGEIESLGPIEGAGGLISLVVEGTDFKDGDMSVVTRLPNLLFAGYVDKKHYSPRKRELREMLERSGRESLEIA